MTPDIARVGGIMREVAAEHILPRFRRLARGEVREKSGPDDLVTVADLDAELHLARRLRDLLPGAGVIGEEAAEVDSTLLPRLAEEGPFWVIDPVDGTYNFSRGREAFGLIVSLVQGGETRAGWILAPIRGELAMAERAGGAWLEARSATRRRLRVARGEPVEAMVGALYASARRSPALHAQIKRSRHRFRRRSYMRCVALEYLALAKGEHHFALFSRLLPWDHAAGVLLHTEAGGHNARLDGTPYSPASQAGAVLLAPDRQSWRGLRALLMPQGG